MTYAALTKAQMIVALVQKDAELHDLRAQLALFTNLVVAEDREQRQNKPVATASPLQLALEGIPAALPLTEDNTVTVPAHKRIRGKKRDGHKEYVSAEGLRFGKDAVVETVILDEPEETKSVPADQKECIGTKEAYRLEAQAQFKVIKYIQHTFKVTTELQGKDLIVTTPIPGQVIAGSFVNASFCSALVTEKYQFHLPLYRIVAKLKSQGITVARSTLTNIEHALGKLLDPVCDEIHRSILKESVIAADETGRKVWNKQENKHKQEYAWILATEQEVFFAMGPGRHGEVAQQLIGKNRKGVLVVDKYAGYQSVREISPELALSYCITHAFRKFRDAQVEEQELATEIMTRYFGILYKVEERIKKKNMSLSKVAAYRLRVTLPVMTALKERLLILQAEYSERPKSKLLEACNYMLSDWDGFMVFVYNPNVPIDNNPTERRLRGHAIGRKNWLWNMSEEGAEWVCNFYTIVESCLLIGVSPQTYLNEVLPLLPKASKADYASLTPRQWKERKEAKAQALQTPKAA